MGNKSSDDFTFCQAGSSADDSSSEAQKAVQDINNITLTDEMSRSSAYDGPANNRSMWNGNILNDGARKEEKVGLLSFSVTNATPIDQSSKAPREQSAEGARCSIKAPAGQNSGKKKPVARAKVPFEKGYSQMDWLKLTRTHPDLAGLKGQSNRRLISISEVKEHQTEGSMWTVLKGRVYNIYPYMKFHPGGVDMLMKAVGKDCTSLFNNYHAWVNDEFLLEKCLVGILDGSSDKK